MRLRTQLLRGLNGCWYACSVLPLGNFEHAGDKGLPGVEDEREPRCSPSCTPNRFAGNSTCSNISLSAGCCDKEQVDTVVDFSTRHREQPPSPSQHQHEACPGPGGCCFPSGGELADGKENVLTEKRPLSGEMKKRVTRDGDASRPLVNSHLQEQEGGAEAKPTVFGLSKPPGEVGGSEQVQDPTGETRDISTDEAIHGREEVVAAPAARAKLNPNDPECSEDAVGDSAQSTNHAPLEPAANDENAGRRLNTGSIQRPKIGLVLKRAGRRGGAAPLSKASSPFQFSTPDLLKTVLAVRGTVSARRQQQQQPQLLAGSPPHHQQADSLDRQPSFQQRRAANEDQDDRSECTVS